MSRSVAVTPIEAAHLDEVGRFLHENLNRRFTPEAWIGCLRHPWSEVRPNYGMQLRDGPRLVGVLLAIYSDQSIDGRIEKICNPHSWCVLDDYRNHGINLVLAAIKQPGYHFTMLTPNPKVAEIFRHLRFKDLDAGVVLFPNLPVPTFGGVAETRRDAIAQHLSGPALRDFALHRDIPWLSFVAFGRGNDTCLVVYKRIRWKKMPCAWLIHVSDPAAFERHRSLLQWALLRKGFLVSRVETRFLQRAPAFAIHTRRTQAKLFSSKTLQDSQIRDLYSELASLDV